MADWKRKISTLPLPNRRSCFTARYPNLHWRRKRCTKTRPHVPLIANHNAPGEVQRAIPRTVGGTGGDFLLQMANPTDMSSVTGSFPSESGPEGSCSVSPTKCGVTETGVGGSDAAIPFSSIPTLLLLASCVPTAQILLRVRGGFSSPMYPARARQM